jgi:four helix bundle protein
MSKIQSYRDLIAWQKAMDLADLIYTVTEPFPKREWFGLAYQMRKSAVSVPSNIAEGNRRRIPSYVNHLEISLGSHGELDTQCELATRRKLISAMHHRQIESLLRRRRATDAWSVAVHRSECHIGTNPRPLRRPSSLN